MAVQKAVRWRPRIYRSSLETVIDGSPARVGPEGEPIPANAHRVEILQYVIFQDTEIGAGVGNPYDPGSSGTERKIAIVDEKVIRLAVSAFAGKTNAESKALWDAQKTAAIAAWASDPELPAKIQAAIGAYLSGFTLLP